VFCDSEKALRPKAKLLHYSISEDALTTLLNVNDLWTDYNMVIIAPTRRSRFQREMYFDKLHVVLLIGVAQSATFMTSWRSREEFEVDGCEGVVE
jgi:hypothetical protein